jgi:hypothetical protein
MGGRLLEGPTMVGRTLDWQDELERWLKPFLDRLGHKAPRRSMLANLANFARRAPYHSRSFCSTTAAAMPALSKMDLQQAAA